MDRLVASFRRFFAANSSGKSKRRQTNRLIIEVLEERTLMTVANNDFAVAIKNIPLTIPVLANDTAPDPSALNVVNVSQPDSGTATLNSDKTVTLEPPPDFVGQIQFTYTVSDGTSTASASVFVTVSPTPEELYAQYLAAVSEADQSFFDTVTGAAISAQSNIDNSWSNAVAASDGLYETYLTTANGALQLYQETHNTIADDFQDAVLPAKISENDQITSALHAHRDAVADPLAFIEAAAAVSEEALDNAVEAHGPDILAANTAFDAAYSAAEQAYASSVAAAFSPAEGPENNIQSALLQAEQNAWAPYASGLTALNAQQQSVESAAASQFASAASASVSSWHTAESAAWEAYVNKLAMLPSVQVPQDKILAPAAEVPTLATGNVLSTLPHVDLNLQESTQEQLFTLQPNPLQEGNVQESLNITGSHDEAFVRRAIASLDVRYRLTHIPVVTPNTAPPAFVNVGPDDAGTINPIVTSAQRARINIRVNLVNLKQRLVDAIYNMVIDKLGDPVRWDANRRQPISDMANRTADDLIRMVDMFLRTHPGARAELGTRLRYLDDRFTAPWCVDWTAAMGAWINRVIVTKGNQHPANAYLDFARGVADGPTIWQQHNFILIGPRGYIWGDPRQIQLSQVDNAAVDPVILLFDAWRELLPIAYRPIPWTSQPRRTPTSLGPLPGPLEVEDDMFWYANRLGDARFTDAQLGLGNELR